MEKHKSKLIYEFSFRAPMGLWGSAITYVHELEDGSMWVGNDEYETRVNFCPMTGRPAKSQMEATESTSPYRDCTYLVSVHNIYETPAKDK